MTLEDMLERKHELGLSYEMISQLSGVPVGTVQKVLGGITKHPRYETLAALERALGRPRNSLPVPGEKTEQGNTLKRKEPGHAPQSAEKTEGPEAEKNICGAAADTDRRTGKTVYNIDTHADYVREAIAYDTWGSGARAEKIGDRQGNYTVEDYLGLPDDQRYELIDGVLYGMAAPTVGHQRLLGKLYLQIGSYVEKKNGPCEVLFAPVDVQLNQDNRTMLQPDLVIVCDHEKTDNGKRLLGAPDFVAEILSPSTASRDLTLKLYKYRDAGVREYWIVDPDNRRVIVHQLESGFSRILSFADPLPVAIYDGECVVDLSEYGE